MCNLILTARRLGAPEIYTPLAENNLCAQVEVLPGNPGTMHVTLRAEEAFQGVIRMALPTAAKDARFFLPGVISLT